MTTIKDGRERTFPVVPRMVIATFDTGVVVVNQWYTLFNLYDVEIPRVFVTTTVANETLEFRYTIDGTTIASAGGFALVAGTYGVLDINLSNLLPWVDVPGADVTWQLYEIKGQHVLLEARKTTVAGASTITANVIYYPH